MTQRILALDMSTKTGWSVLNSYDSGEFSLAQFGKIKQIHQPDLPYPQSMVKWAYDCFEPIVKLVDEYAPDILVIEETAAGSKSIESQKILEYLHFLVAKMITDSQIPVIYLLTEQWRRMVGCQMTKEEKLHNKKHKTLKNAKVTKRLVQGGNAPDITNAPTIVYDENGKRLGKITRKHVNVRRANEVFGKYFEEPLRLKDEDLADSLLLGYAYHVKRTKKKEAV